MTSSNGNIFRVTGHLCGKLTGELPAQRPVTRSFDVFFDLRLNKRLSKQPWGWWFETPAWSLWRHRNECRHLRVILPQNSCNWTVCPTPYPYWQKDPTGDRWILLKANMMNALPCHNAIMLDLIIQLSAVYMEYAWLFWCHILPDIQVVQKDRFTLMEIVTNLLLQKVNVAMCGGGNGAKCD